MLLATRCGLLLGDAEALRHRCGRGANCGERFAFGSSAQEHGTAVAAESEANSSMVAPRGLPIRDPPLVAQEAAAAGFLLRRLSVTAGADPQCHTIPQNGKIFRNESAQRSIMAPGPNKGSL